MVAERVAGGVLQMADQDVVPVNEVQGAVRSEFHVNRAEIAVIRNEEVLPVVAFVAGAIVFHCVLFHPQEADGIVDQQITLHLIGEMTAGYEFQARSEEHTSELQSLMRISYAVFCLKKKNNIK